MFLWNQLLVSYLLVAGELLSFLELEGDGSVPPFLGRTVPLLTVDLRGRAAIIGLAERWKDTWAELHTALQSDVYCLLFWSHFMLRSNSHY